MAEHQRPNTLGLQNKELDGLLSKIESGNASAAAKAGRVFSRWKFPHKSVAVKVLQPGGSDIETRMACRNLSTGGIGLLHRSYVHVGTDCVVIIPHPNKGDLEVSGKVVRCMHVTGMVHEIGILFDEEIPLREILRPDPMQEVYSVENVDPEQLVGTILLVEDSDMDVKLVKHFLNGTQVRVKHAATLAEADELVKSGVGLVLCDIHLGEENGGTFAKKLHERAPNGPPVVMISADRAQTTYELISKPYIQGFLAKPFSQVSLIRTIAEFIIDPESDEPAPDGTEVQADAQIVSVLLPELAKACGKLEEAVKSGEAPIVLSLLMQVSGIAPVVGLDDLAAMTETMSQQLATTMDMGRVTDRMDEVLRLCREATGH